MLFFKPVSIHFNFIFLIFNLTSSFFAHICHFLAGIGRKIDEIGADLFIYRQNRGLIGLKNGSIGSVGGIIGSESGGIGAAGLVRG